MSVKRFTPHARAALAVKRGSTAGSAILVAKAAGKKASYEWEFSLDRTAWTALPATLVARTSVSGLVVGSTYYFRMRSLTKGGMSDWGQIVSMVAA